MREFKITDSTKRWMKTMTPAGMLEHGKILFLAEIHHTIPNKGYRVYIAFCDVTTMQFYIEELVGSGLRFIEEDRLAEDLNNFLDMHGIKTFKAMQPWCEQPMVPYLQPSSKIFT